MLKKLEIKNIVLIQSETLEFQKGFHVFSGETGAGKTAVLQALSLILGSRLDIQIIRKGELEASIEAFFEIPESSKVYDILSDADIEIEADENLVIKRILKSNGKSRILVNCQWVPLHLLKKIAPFIIDIVSQHGTQQLFDLDTHRTLLDLYSQSTKISQRVSTLFKSLQNLKIKLKELEKKEQDSEIMRHRWQVDYEELESAKLSAFNEEELIFNEYQNLSQAQDLIQALQEATDSIQEADPSILFLLNNHLKTLIKFSSSDSQLHSMVESFQNALEELKEVSSSLLSYKDQISEDPERLEALDQRLKLLNHLKKKYGPTLENVIAYREDLSVKLNAQGSLHNQKSQLTEMIQEAQTNYEKEVKLLSKARTRTKPVLEEKIINLFENLNLKNALFHIELTPKEPDEYGAEEIEFFLRANIGEKKTSLRDKVSGGELSRVLLALKVLLAEKDETPTLIFDEIDANLGGETAPKIGQLLKTLSASKQIIAITHLPQVAVYADHHYQISKKQEKDRTLSLVAKLNEKQKVLEIERMLGGKALSPKAQDLAKDLLRSTE
ncbi:MAG: DNA repair protein RecN [Chlamydiae bacterium]|nr:DNA repair protein RecN [Chlamydiota bacterium]